MNNFDPEYEIDYEGHCPKCGHSPTHSRSCLNFCDDGWFDCADEDPNTPGEEDEICTECYGTGIERWCPKCGLNIQRFEYAKEFANQRIHEDARR